MVTLPQLSRELILDPKARVRSMVERSSKVDISVDRSPRMYYQSALEVFRMANIYLEEKDYERAFLLFSRFVS